MFSDIKKQQYENISRNNIPAALVTTVCSV